MDDPDNGYAPMRFQPVLNDRPPVFGQNLGDKYLHDYPIGGPTPVPGPDNDFTVTQSEDVIIYFMVRSNNNPRLPINENPAYWKTWIGFKNWLRLFPNRQINLPIGAFEITGAHLAYVYFPSRKENAKDIFAFFEVEIIYIGKPGTKKEWNIVTKTWDIEDLTYDEWYNDVDGTAKVRKNIYPTDLRDDLDMPFPSVYDKINWDIIGNTWRYIFVYNTIFKDEDKKVNGYAGKHSFKDIMYKVLEFRYKKFINTWLPNNRDTLSMGNVKAYYGEGNYIKIPFDPYSYAELKDCRIMHADYKKARLIYIFKKKGFKVDGPIKINADTVNFYD